MRKRTKAREYALQLLYKYDIEKVMLTYFESFFQSQKKKKN